MAIDYLGARGAASGERPDLAKFAKFGILRSGSRDRHAERKVNLTDEQDAFIEEVVRSGKYQNASEAMRDALRGLQHRLKADELKLELLRTRVKAGLDALDRGSFTEVDTPDLDGALDDLAAPAR